MTFFHIGLVLVTIVLQSVSGDVCDGESFEPLNVIDGTDGSIFDDLTQDELETAEKYMFDQDEFSLTRVEEEGLDKAFIYLMETLPPPKDQALKYLDEDGPRPDKYVRVVLYRANLDPPVIEEYKVGPISKTLTHSLIRRLDWHRRNNVHWKQFYALVSFIEKSLSLLDDGLMAATGYRFNNCTNNCLLFQPTGTGFYSDPNTQKIWLQILKGVSEGYTLHPIGFNILVDLTNNDPNEWNVERLWWRGTHYTEVSDLAGYFATNMDDITKTTVVEVDNEMFSTLHTRGPPLTDTPRRGPSAKMPDGRRHSVDGHHVKWQGWEFDFNVRTRSGVQAHDVRFLGQRIVYELALNEMMVDYAGGDPMTSHNTYVDSAYLMGGETYELIPGLDCPEDADYFDFAHFIYGNVVVFSKSACLFEFHSGVPLRRHYQSDFAGSYTFTQGMPDNTLVLRTIATIWNYDYVVDFMFHQNGVLEVKWTLSGYILTEYYMGDYDDMLAFQIRPNTMGSLHTHAANFKVDLDIQGTSNRFETLNIKAKKVDDEVEPGHQIWQQYVEPTLKQTEKDAAYKYNFDTPKYLLFYNNQSRDAYGNARAYRIVPKFMAKMVGGDEYFEVWKGVSWANYQLAVSRYKDNEQSCSSMYMNNNPFNPDVSLHQFIEDDESVVDQDLVLWVTLATHHIPHTEDLPITTSSGVHGSFYLLPYNYFPEDPSMSSTDNIRTVPDKSKPGVHKYVEKPDLPNCPGNMKGLKERSSGATSVTLGYSLLFVAVIAIFNMK